MQFLERGKWSLPGYPGKLAKALIKIASEKEPSLRFVAGADAVAAADQVA
jgi:hypothetical protein